MDLTMLLSTLSSAKDLAALLMSERDRQKAAAIQLDLTEKITQAQLQVGTLLGQLVEKDAALRGALDRLRQLESHERERNRYRLASLSAGRQVFAYLLRPAAELGDRVDEPRHFICQPCFDAGHKAVLIQGAWMSVVHWKCPLCACVFDGDSV